MTHSRKLKRGTKVNAYGLKFTVLGQIGQNVFLKSPKGRLHEVKRSKITNKGE